MESSFFQLGSQFAVVVDLAIKRDTEGAGFVEHRLRASRRQIQNGQPPMRQPGRSVWRNPDSRAIRAARNHVVADREKLRLADGPAVAIGEYGCYATHEDSRNRLHQGWFIAAPGSAPFSLSLKNRGSHPQLSVLASFCLETRKLLSLHRLT